MQYEEEEETMKKQRKKKKKVPTKYSIFTTTMIYNMNYLSA